MSKIGHLRSKIGHFQLRMKFLIQNLSIFAHKWVILKQKLDQKLSISTQKHHFRPLKMSEWSLLTWKSAKIEGGSFVTVKVPSNKSFDIFKSKSVFYGDYFRLNTKLKSCGLKVAAQSTFFVKLYIRKMLNCCWKNSAEKNDF